MFSGLPVSCVSEVVGAFVGGEGGEELADASPSRFGGACVELSQEGLQLGEELFDRIKVGRVGRQEEELGSSGARVVYTEARTPTAEPTQADPCLSDVLTTRRSTTS